MKIRAKRIPNLVKKVGTTLTTVGRCAFRDEQCYPIFMHVLRSNTLRRVATIYDTIFNLEYKSYKRVEKQVYRIVNRAEDR